MVQTRQRAPRTRNAAATREAMLVAARRHFARDSYDNVGLRDIARAVGVDPALVGRYFGSKEQLFIESVRGGRALMKEVSRDGLVEHFTSLFLDDNVDRDAADVEIDRILILLHSASSPKASRIIRDTIDEDILVPIERLLDGEDARLRATLCMAVLMGAGIMRNAVANDALHTADPGVLRTRLRALFSAALSDRPEKV